MRQFTVTLTLSIPIQDDISDDDLEEEISYQVERHYSNVVMVDYQEEF